MEKRGLGKFTPGGVECVAGHGKFSGATSADEVRGILFAGEGRCKAVMWRKLNNAYHSLCMAFWAKPMRLVAACGRFFQHIGRKARSKKFQFIAVEIRVGLLDVEKFLFERIALHRHSLMLFDEFKIRRLMVDKLLLDVDNGGVDVSAVREAAGRLNRLKEHLEGCCRICRSGGYRRNIKHWFDPLWCVEYR